MQGSLSSTPIPEILRTIYNERLSGELISRRSSENGNIEKRVLFERGQVAFASSSQPEDRIGETLVRYNKLSREQLNQFFSQLPPGQRLGKALVDSNILTERELVNYVTLQFIDIIYSLFTWKDGTYQFVSGENKAPDELKLKFSTPTIILEGMRRVNDFDLIRKGIGSASKLLHTTQAGRSKIQAIAFNPLELNLMNMAKEPVDLLRVLVNCKERPEKVLQSIYSLLVIGTLEQIEDPQTQANNVEMAQQVIAIFPGSDISTAEVEAVRNRIVSRDPRIILGVQPHNNINEVYDAYLQLATKFHPDKFVNAPKQIKSELELIFNSINESYNFIRTSPVAPAPSPAIMAPPNTIPSQMPYGTANSGYLNQQPMQSMQPMQPMQSMQPMQPMQSMQPMQPMQVQNPSMPLPNTRLQTGAVRNPWQTGAIPQAQIPPTAGGYMTPQQGGYYPQQPNQGLNPLAQLQSAKRSSITRAVSDEIEYKGEKDKNPFSALQKKNLDVNQAISEMLDYFDDRRAPLFTSDALSKLLRTKPPTHITQKELVETIMNWARNKSAVMGWPIAIILLRVITLIKQAETSQLIEDFNGEIFYPGFIQELTNYCAPPEAEEFMRGLSSL